MPTPVAGLPVGNTTVSGSDITVSALLNQPRRLEQRIGEMTNLSYWADLVLPNVGDAPTGAVIFEQWSPTFAELDRDAEELADDVEVPLAGHVEGDLTIARAKTDGLGYVVTDAMKRRNQRYVMDRRERGLANTIALKFNGRAVSVIDKAITDNSRTYAATDWSALVTDGATPDPKAEWPHSTIALLRAQQTADRIPFNYDGMIAHPLDVWRLATIYQVDGTTQLAGKLGLSRIIEDNTGDIDRGSPILYSSGNVGGTAWEEPIKTEVVPERRRRRTVVQTTGTAAFFVDNPYGLLKLTGVAAADLAG